MAKDKKGKGSGTKDACYHKVKARYSVWPSAYASGALVKCRKKGAANWGNKSESFEVQEGRPMYDPERVKKATSLPAINPKQDPRKNEKNQKIGKSADAGVPNADRMLKKRTGGASLPPKFKKEEVELEEKKKSGDPCWVGYKQVGMKKKGAKMVPNCVPEETEVEEGYKPIDRDKENKMYRRAGNLARKSLSSKGKKKLDSASKSAKIVSAISRQKENERFDKMADEKARSNYNEEIVQSILEKCWAGYEKKGMKTMFGKRYPNCVKKKATRKEEVEVKESDSAFDFVKNELIKKHGAAAIVGTPENKAATAKRKAEAEKNKKKPAPDTRTDAQKMTDATGPRPGSRYRGD